MPFLLLLLLPIVATGATAAAITAATAITCSHDGIDRVEPNLGHAGYPLDGGVRLMGTAESSWLYTELHTPAAHHAAPCTLTRMGNKMAHGQNTFTSGDRG